MKMFKKRNGFTLVELIIVVIILAILAAIIIPQLRGSTDDARLATLDTDLTAMRSAIELYYVQHNNAYPGNTANDTVLGSTNPHATVDAAFIAQMTKYSDSSGNTSDVYNATTFRFGPYVKKQIPANPYPNAATTTDAQARSVDVDTATTTLGSATATDTVAQGWVFVRGTGEFFANNTTYDNR